MGAGLIYGRALEKKSEVINGLLVTEILPVEGGYYGPAYSTVWATVDYAVSLGVSPECWPIYYGFSGAEIDLADVYDRCNRLSQRISALPIDALSGHAFLQRVAVWLAAGECFVITE